MWYLIGFAYLLVGISVFRYIKEGGEREGGIIVLAKRKQLKKK